ncbi:MAG: hypothetical protein M3440_02335, partial [Chloroflexota bacterium]|nr:hypothetical protein [Chloroflexota bacterium]
EARWALFWDLLDVQWEYEPQGYNLANGQRYLPDFWLSTMDTFFEVKPSSSDGVVKAQRLVEDLFCQGISINVAISDGPPKPPRVPGGVKHFPEFRLIGWTENDSSMGPYTSDEREFSFYRCAHCQKVDICDLDGYSITERACRGLGHTANPQDGRMRQNEKSLPSPGSSMLFQMKEAMAHRFWNPGRP